MGGEPGSQWHRFSRGNHGPWRPAPLSTRGWVHRGAGSGRGRCCGEGMCSLLIGKGAPPCRVGKYSSGKLLFIKKVCRGGGQTSPFPQRRTPAVPVLAGLPGFPERMRGPNRGERWSPSQPPGRAGPAPLHRRARGGRGAAPGGGRGRRPRRPCPAGLVHPARAPCAS